MKRVDVACAEQAGQSLEQRAEAKTGLPEDLPFLTVIIPAYNEIATIETLLQRVVEAHSGQVIVVDDGSSDGTLEVLANWEAEGKIEFLQHEKNSGKGAAIRTGLDHAQGKFTIVQDADLEYDPNDYELLLRPLRDGKYRVVYGSRYLAKNGNGARRDLFRLGVSVLNVFVRVLYGAKLSDEATCYKVFPTETLRAMQLECERFEFCPEVTAKAVRMGLEIHEVPINYHPRSVEEGKKIQYRDGWEAILCLWKWRKWRPSGD